MSEPAVTRRALLGVAATGAAALGAGVVLERAGGAGGAPAPSRPPRARPPAAVAVPAERGDHPAAQHAWEATYAIDAHGPATPRHARLLMFELATAPTVAGATRIEAALRRIEAAAPSGPRGLLLAVGWSPAWFAAIGQPSPVPRPVALSLTELPDLQVPAACVHLASDAPGRIDAAEAALIRATRGVLRLVDRRSGVNGAGLARRATRGLRLAGGGPSRRSPLLMGFRSGQPRGQATERDVTVVDGRWAGSTCMHVSEIALSLGSWYHDLTEEQRVARMFAPQVTLRAVRRDGADVVLPEASIEETAREHGLVGHKQAAAQARRDGRPVILRRDVSGVRDGQPVTHFVALARDIEDVAATRRAMDAAAASAADPGVGAQVNNGINEWTSVRARANFLVPPRTRRTFPGLPGWDRA